jgi:hypothetical protein
MGGKAFRPFNSLNNSTSQPLNFCKVWMSRVLRNGRESIAPV